MLLLFQTSILPFQPFDVDEAHGRGLDQTDQVQHGCFTIRDASFTQVIVIWGPFTDGLSLTLKCKQDNGSLLTLQNAIYPADGECVIFTLNAALVEPAIKRIKTIKQKEKITCHILAAPAFSYRKSSLHFVHVCSIDREIPSMIAQTWTCIPPKAVTFQKNPIRPAIDWTDAPDNLKTILQPAAEEMALQAGWRAIHRIKVSQITSSYFDGSHRFVSSIVRGRNKMIVVVCYQHPGMPTTITFREAKKVVTRTPFTEELDRSGRIQLALIPYTISNDSFQVMQAIYSPQAYQNLASTCMIVLAVESLA